MSDEPTRAPAQGAPSRAQLRAAALFDDLRTEVARRRPATVAAVVCLPVTELISIDAMASVATVAWWCRVCDHRGSAATRDLAHRDGVTHLTAEHRGVVDFRGGG
ncbi:MAG: hypothetical protein ACRDSF_00685 [Pseudonocardiaceae bacterium]